MACPEQRVPLPEVGEVRIIGLLSHNPLDSWDFADFHWRLALARPNHDRMLSLSLAAAGVAHYAPLVERVVGFEVLAGKVVVSTRKGPMFPGYVFVGGEMGRGQGVHKHVLRFEAIPGQDRVVADLERLEAMRLAQHPICEAPLEPGQHVLIQGRPYKGVLADPTRRGRRLGHNKPRRHPFRQTAGRFFDRYNEVIGKALRRTVPMFPPLAVRELVANALIHQDFFITGSGPMVEIFDNRMEITNPGEPLISAERFIDSPPRSRNEGIASLMRRFRICEERGSGIDKVISQVELFQLPAPLFEVPEGFMRTVLFAHRPLREMDRNDRVRACYRHACLKYDNRDFLTNASVRERFGIKEDNKSMASRYICEALDAGEIKPYDDTAPRSLRKYLPRWA